MRQNEKCSTCSRDESDERNARKYRRQEEQSDAETHPGDSHCQDGITHRPGLAPAHKSRNQRPNNRKPKKQNREDEHPKDGACNTASPLRHPTSLSYNPCLVRTCFVFLIA